MASFWVIRFFFLGLCMLGGYAISQGESVSGASAVLAPIFGMDGSVVAVINVTGPIDRFDRTAINAIAPDLLNSTKMISEQLGFQPHEDQTERAP